MSDGTNRTTSRSTRRGFLRLAVGASASSAVAGLAAGRSYTPPAPTLPTGEHRPAMFVHLAELAAVRSRVDAGDDPWASAYEAFIADARESLRADPRSVVGAGVGGHEFGESEPGEASRADYRAAIEMGDRIRDLGLAYQLTGRDAFAERAVAFLDHWFLDGRSRMAPEHTDGIELYITLPKMWYGAELVRDHPAWKDAGGSQSGLVEWIRTFLDNTGTGTPEWVQNIFVWRELCRAAGATYAGDGAVRAAAFERIRTHAFEQLRRDGTLRNETERSEGLSYSLYAMKAFVTAAELGRHYGEELYGFEKYGESAIKRMFDAHAPFFATPEAFDDRFGEARGFAAREREEGASAYELAHSRWEDGDYLDVITSRGSPIKNEPTYVDQHQDAIDSRGRPLRDERLLGWTTLTHGNLFDL